MTGTRLAHWLLFPLSVALLTSCASSGHYVWVADLPSDQGASGDYVIDAGDVLSLRVFNQDAMSSHARVRSDGKISIPFVGDLSVRAKTLATVAHELELRLKDYVVTPKVTVTLDEAHQPTVAVVGEVTHPGVFGLEPPSGVLRALAVAGGMTDYASRDNIYVLRDGHVRRIRFTYRSLIDNESRAATFRLRTGDTVVVE